MASCVTVPFAIISFARHAPDDTMLVFKHHPMDRGYADYNRLIRSESARLGLSGRVIYIHDQRLPPLLDNARGVVVINSTVGLSAIQHGRPTKVCGRAIYDMPGLTAPVSLDAFWRRATEFSPDMALFRKFRDYVISRTQINGSYYKRIKESALSCGIIWDNGLGGQGEYAPAGRSVTARGMKTQEHKAGMSRVDSA